MIAVGSNGVAHVNGSNKVDPVNFRFQRKQKRSSDLSDKVDGLLDYILKGRLSQNWSGDCNFTSIDDINIGGEKSVTQTFEFTFNWISQKPVDHNLVDREIKQIQNNIVNAVKANNIQGTWRFVDDENCPISGGLGDDSENILYPSWDDFADVFLNRQDPLWNASIQQIEEHPCFEHIFGLGHTIRMMIRAIHHAAETRGKHLAHLCVWGSPGGAKTTVANALIDYINQPIIDWNPEYRAVLKIDADSSTQAGVTERILRLATGVENAPNFCFLEEAEKCHESMWKGLLSVFDDRQTISKLNFRGKRQAHTPIFGFVTVNNMPKFEDFLSGAVASRFSNRIEVPIPTPHIMEQILLYKIDQMGGDREWARAAMELAHRHKIRDPRQIINFLAGREGLLDGTYEEDYEFNLKAAEKARHAYELEEGTTDKWFADNLYK